MSREKSPSEGWKSKSRHFPLRLFLPRRPKGRFETNGAGLLEKPWSAVTEFQVCEGADGGLIALYDSRCRPHVEIRELLFELGYTDLLAHGTIDQQRRELRFQQPKDADFCKERLIDAADDTEFVRFFGTCKAFGPNGESFGEIVTFCIRPNGNV